MIHNKELTLIKLFGFVIIAIVLLLVAAKFIPSQQGNKNQEEVIPPIVSESHVLEAVENAEILRAAIDEWRQKKPNYNFDIDSPDITFTGTDLTTPKKALSKRAENAPDIGCLPPNRETTQYCQTALFTYDAICISTNVCVVNVYENEYENNKDRFYLTVATDPTTHKWNRACTINDKTSGGDEICTYLSTKGWTYITPAMEKQVEEIIQKGVEKVAS